MPRKIKLLIFVFLLLFVGLVLYKYSPYKIKFLGHYDKVWAHRVDSEEKLKLALPFYRGVELDLVYDENNDLLDVTHPPTPSIGLSFSKYLSNLPKNASVGLWLDIKNLTPKTANAIFTNITSTLKKQGLKYENIIIETRFPEALPRFTNAGFKTSYYLKNWLYKTTSKRLNTELDSIKNVLGKYPEIAISFDYRNYAIVDSVFPNKDKLTWILSSTSYKDFLEVRTILKDTTVKVVLAPYHAFKGNR
jgi:hypothetical protein